MIPAIGNEKVALAVDLELQAVLLDEPPHVLDQADQRLEEPVTLLLVRFLAQFVVQPSAFEVIPEVGSHGSSFLQVEDEPGHGKPIAIEHQGQLRKLIDGVIGIGRVGTMQLDVGRVLSSIPIHHARGQTTRHVAFGPGDGVLAGLVLAPLVQLSVLFVVEEGYPLEVDVICWVLGVREDLELFVHHQPPMLASLHIIIFQLFHGTSLGDLAQHVSLDFHGFHVLQAFLFTVNPGQLNTRPSEIKLC